jgi:hypothetical protein
MRWPASIVVGSLGLLACTTSDGNSSGGEPPCVQGLSVDCKAQYDPATFDTIFTKILKPTCASGTGTCHTSDAAMGGLVFEDPDRAHAMLLGSDGSRARVLPGDPACSLLMKRLSSTDPSYRMPRGPTPLTAGEQCTITKWIAAGGAR